MKWLCYGGRRETDRAMVWAVLDTLLREGRLTIEVDGEAPGIDTYCKNWAISRGVQREGYPIRADERALHGNRAGNRRNQRMLDTSQPDRALEFPGGTGTLDMRTRLLAAGITPIVIPRRR